MAGVRAIPITDECSGYCHDCPLIYTVDQTGDARLRLMAHVKQTGHTVEVRMHTLFEYVPA
jgi:hypothetical protein